MAFIRSSKHSILALCVVTILSISGLLAIVRPVKAAPAQEQSMEQQLPGSTSQLPLVSILGIGMLSGGIISVLRTRPGKEAAK
jgi:hypothetical protein